MGKRRLIIRNKKERGEWAELCFMAAAMEHGLPVAKPWGDSRSYDVVAGWPGHFLAVQVKSTVCELCGGYACTLRGCHSRKYRPGAYDFLAGYVIPEDAWYIIPEKLVRGRERVSLASDSERAHYEKYREAWHLLEDPGKNIDLQCAEGECAEQMVMQRTRSAMPTFARMLGVLAWRRAVDCLYTV